MSEMRSMATTYADRTSARTMGPRRDVGVIAAVIGFVKIDLGLRDA